MTYSRAGHGVTGEYWVVDVEVDTRVGCRITTWETNSGWDGASTTGDLELSARDVELSWHRLV